jgi:hypothetical protein
MNLVMPLTTRGAQVGIYGVALVVVTNVQFPVSS